MTMAMITIGKIPKSLCSLTELETLDLSDNNLEGCIPDGIGKLTSLKRLYLYKNKLTGDNSGLTYPLNESFD